MTRAKIGDIFEIKITSGYGYFQLTHIHSDPPKMGGLIRVLGKFPEAQVNPEELAYLPTIFKTFFPINQALKIGAIKKVGPGPIPPADQEFPIFRGGTKNPATNVVDIWWFWDGNKSSKVGKISEEQFEMPIQEVINDTLLAERIESNWTPKEYR